MSENPTPDDVPAAETPDAAPTLNLTDLTDAQIAEQLAQITDDIAALSGRDAGTFSLEEASTAETLAAELELLTGERGRRTKEADERVTKALAAAASHLSAPQTPPVDETVEEVRAAVRPTIAAAAAAAAGTVDVRKTRQSLAELAGGPITPADDKIVWEVSAASGIPGTPAGSAYNTGDEIASALIRACSSMPVGTSGAYARQSVAQIRRKRPLTHVADGDIPDQRIIDAITDETRLRKGLTAAGGAWCAPGEIMYDLCSVETLDGLWDLPTFTVNRGFVRYTEGPDFGKLYCGCGFSLTKADAEAGKAKTCCEVECAEFKDVELEIDGVCIKASVFTNRAYPELVQNYVKRALIAHQHKLNAKRIERAVSLAKTVAGIKEGTSAITTVANATALQATDIRYQYRLARTTTLEVVLPYWAKELFRSDLSKRFSCDGGRVSDATIDGWFSERGLRVHWVYDWQDGFACPTPAAGGKVFGGADPITEWPKKLKVLIFPAGTYALGTADLITLDAEYNTVDLVAGNKFTALFTEEAWLLLQRCTQARVFELDICPNGATGPVQDFCAENGGAPVVANTKK